MYGQLYRGFESHPLRQTFCWDVFCRGDFEATSVGEKGSDARRRPKVMREAYSLYVERVTEGANEADGPLSPTDKGGPC